MVLWPETAMILGFIRDLLLGIALQFAAPQNIFNLWGKEISLSAFPHHADCNDSFN
jgi:hypothetical protein